MFDDFFGGIGDIFSGVGSSDILGLLGLLGGAGVGTLGSVLGGQNQPPAQATSTFTGPTTFQAPQPDVQQQQAAFNVRRANRQAAGLDQPSQATFDPSTMGDYGYQYGYTPQDMSYMMRSPSYYTQGY